jgi:hypothetical protein
MNSQLRNLWEQKKDVWEIDEWFQRLRELPQDIDHCVTIVWVRVVEYGWANKNGELVALRMLRCRWNCCLREQSPRIERQRLRDKSAVE